MDSTSAHLSQFTLDAFALNALPPERHAAAVKHLETCATCRARADELASLRQHFTTHVVPHTAAALRRAPAWHTAWRWALPALAAVSATVLMLVRPVAPPVAPEEEPEYGVKGPPVLQVFAHRGERTWQVQEGEVLAAGDQVRFRVGSGGLPYVLLVSVDGTGQVSAYHPFGADQSASIPPQELVELPGSVVLDPAPGPERLFVLFSRKPLSFAAVKPALHELAAGGAQAIRARTRIPIAVAAQDSFLFEKAQEKPLP